MIDLVIDLVQWKGTQQIGFMISANGMDDIDLKCKHSKLMVVASLEEE